MNLKRVKGLLIQEFFITARSFEVILDNFVFPVASIMVFGFLAMYLAGSAHVSIAYSLLAGMLLWQVIFIMQYAVSVGSLWNIWSHNLSNMFITPLSLPEYLLAQSTSGVCKALAVFLPSSFIAMYLFHYNIFAIGVPNIVFYLANLIFFAISFGLIMLGLIFRFGTRIQAFAWGILPIFQPLSAAFYPVSILPKPIQFIAQMLPPTHIFEALRANLTQPNTFQWQQISLAVGENCLYFVVALLFFNFMYNQSKKVGQFARLEG